MRRRLVIALIVIFLFCSTGFADKKPKKKELSAQQENALKLVFAQDSVRLAQLSIKVVSLKTGHSLFQRNANQMLIPASTNKVISGAAALDVLSPQYRFKTMIYYDGDLSPDGTLNGNLYLKGGGDPSINLENAWLIAHQIRAHGVKIIEGDIIGDASFHDDVRHYKQWGDVGTRAYHAPLCALSVNFNTMGVFVAPGQKSGDPGNAVIDPDNGLYTVENHLLTTQGGRTRVAISLKGNTCIVSGQIPVHAKGQTFYRSIENPSHFALATFKRFMENEGIACKGKIREGLVPADARSVFVHQSRPLSQIIRELYRSSNNFTAESTNRTLGAITSGQQGTQSNGASAVIDWLKAKKLHDMGVVITDASGLSRENRVSAKVLVNILKYMWNKPEVSAEFVDAMAIGGVDGTLRGRFRNTPLENRVRAKSGLLWGCITLAGYCYDSNNEPYAFAFMVNNYSKDSSVREIQKVIEDSLNIMMK